MPRVVLPGAFTFEIDVVFIGPADLSTSMGLAGQAKHPETLALIEKMGTVARDAAEYAYWRERGFQWLCSGTSAFPASGASQFVNTIHDLEKSVS